MKMKGVEKKGAGLNQRWADSKWTLISSDSFQVSQLFSTAATTSLYVVSMCVCLWGQTGAEFKPYLCTCVCISMMALTLGAKWLGPTEHSREIHSLHHTAQHWNSKGSRTWGGERSGNTSHKQKGSVAWKSVPWQNSGNHDSQLVGCSEGKANLILKSMSIQVWAACYSAQRAAGVKPWGVFDEKVFQACV